MEKGILFEIKESNLDTGLRGIPVGHCVTSEVDPKLGLSYRGYSVKDLAFKDPEEVIYLLFNGELPNVKQLENFKNELIELSVIDQNLIDHLHSLPKHAHPMNWFISALNYQGMSSSTKDWRNGCLGLIAVIPILVANIYQIKNSWETIPSKPQLGYMENFVNMINPPKKKPKLLDLMRVYDILHFDHGGGNLSTFVGKSVSSGHASLYESLTAAMCGLAGPLHGKASQEAFRFIKKCYQAIGSPDEEKIVKDYLEKIYLQGGVFFGFGHAVLRAEDSRATIQYELGKKIAYQEDLFKLALKVRKAGVEILSQQTKIANPYPNVDAISGTLLNAMGLEDDEFYTVLFGMSRCVGIACQIYYERVLARGGRGSPIIRPKYLYSGPTH